MICRSFPVCSTQMERKKAGMKCVIFAGLPAAPELHSWWADADYVIAADRGHDSLMAYGVNPDLVVGDFDSLGEVPNHPKVWSRIFCWAITTVRRVRRPVQRRCSSRRKRMIPIPITPPARRWSWARRMSLSWAVWEARGWTIRWPTCKRWCFWQKTECVRHWRIRTMR